MMTELLLLQVGISNGVLKHIQEPHLRNIQVLRSALTSNLPEECSPATLTSLPNLFSEVGVSESPRLQRGDSKNLAESIKDSHLCQEGTPSSHLAGPKNLIPQYTPTDCKDSHF